MQSDLTGAATRVTAEAWCRRNGILDYVNGHLFAFAVGIGCGGVVSGVGSADVVGFVAVLVTNIVHLTVIPFDAGTVTSGSGGEGDTDVVVRADRIRLSHSGQPRNSMDGDGGGFYLAATSVAIDGGNVEGGALGDVPVGINRRCSRIVGIPLHGVG